jgi:hypothetical protein
MLRVAAAALGIVWLGLVGAFALGAISVQPSVEGLVAAAAALLIAGGGFLYAWREPGR